MGGLEMMFWNGNMGGWGSVLMVISFVLFWGAVIAAIVLLARALGPANRGTNPGSSPGYAEDLLAQRFARGEIDESEYTARLDVLRRGPRR
jgi:putative membrane protein